MATVVKCPDCGARLKFAKDMVGRRTRCTACDHRFVIEVGCDEFVSEGPPSRVRTPRRVDDDDDFDHRIRRRPPQPRVAPFLILASVAGVVLLAAGSVLAWYLLMQNSPAAPAPVGMPGQDGVIPPVPVAVVEGEEFIDLPERGKDVDRIAGLDVPAAPPKSAPVAGNGPGKVALTNAQATRDNVPAGVTFQVDYEFMAGGPTPGRRYTWTVRTAKGRVFTQTVLNLQARGTLTGRVLGLAWLDAPYQTYLSVEIVTLPGIGPGFGPRFGPGLGPRMAPFGGPFAVDPERISDVIDIP